MADPNMRPERDFARRLAHQAGTIMLRHWSAPDVQTKADGTPVTTADTRINQLVIAEIARQFPHDVVVGEEASTGGYGPGRRWICDPIDGTAAFVAGVPTSMFSLALVEDGRPVVAVAYEPHRRDLFVALRGQGAFWNDRPIHVSDTPLSEGIVALAPDYVRTGLIDLPFMTKLLALDKRLSIFDGAVFRSCLVAQGRIVGFPHPRVKPYDIAAVHLIVEEAGGRVTSITGQPLDYAVDFEGAVISNGTAHADLLALFTTDNA